MRWLVLALLAVNLIYFGWRLDRGTRADVQNAAAAQAVPSGLAQLTLIAELAEPPPLRAAEPPAAADLPAPIGPGEGLVAQLPEIGTTPAPAADAGFSCFTYGPLPEERQAVWLSDWFRSRRAEVRSRATEDPSRQLFWVYLAPRESLQSALAVVEDLRKRGVRDYRLISKGDLGNAVSLGLFSSQEAVNTRLQELKEKGFQPVVVPYSNVQRFHWVDVRVPAVPEILDQMFDGYPSRYSSVPVQCSEIAMNGGSP
jgi:hypothetical protein